MAEDSVFPSKGTAEFDLTREALAEDKTQRPTNTAFVGWAAFASVGLVVLSVTAIMNPGRASSIGYVILLPLFAGAAGLFWILVAYTLGRVVVRLEVDGSAIAFTCRSGKVRRLRWDDPGFFVELGDATGSQLKIPGRFFWVGPYHLWSRTVGVSTEVPEGAFRLISQLGIEKGLLVEDRVMTEIRVFNGMRKLMFSSRSVGFQGRTASASARLD